MRTTVSTIGESYGSRRLPAWVLSLLLHTLVMLALPWLLAGPGRPATAEGDREVGIVLARVNAQQEYFFSAESASPNTPAAESATLPSASRLLDFQSPDLALPEARAATPAISLPGQFPAAADAAVRRVPGGIDATGLLAEEAERRARAAAAGPATALSVFGGPAITGRSFVFLIDRSKSMGSEGLGALAAAEAELIRALRGLQPVHRFQVIAYHHRCVYLRERRLLPATVENIAAIEGHLRDLAAFGATEHEQALFSALHMEPDAIVLLTDGGDPSLTAGQLRRIGRVAGTRTAIHCIQFGRGPRREMGRFLERLAAENNGSFGYVDLSAK